MANRYLTHLGTIILVHVLVLLGTWTITQKNLPSVLPHLDSSVLKIRVASNVLMAKRSAPTTVSERKTFVPTTPKQTSAKVENKALTAESILGSAEKMSLRDAFKAELREKINENKFYPIMSKRLGQTGIVIVAFTLLEDGHIIDIRLDTPSPYERLNESALQAVRKVHKFRPIPRELGEERMDLKVPVRFFTI